MLGKNLLKNLLEFGYSVLFWVDYGIWALLLLKCLRMESLQRLKSALATRESM